MRVLHMIPDIGISNGIMSVIINYAKAMPENIKFDVVYFRECENTKQSEIEALGGRVFKINPPSPKNAVKRDMDKFFSQHKGEWDVLHINAPHFAVFIAPAARRAGINKICVHCHSSQFSLNPKNEKRNELFTKAGLRFTDKKFACGIDAGRFWFGNDDAFTVLKNAIDCEKYAFSEKIRTEKRDELDLADKIVITHIGKTDITQKNHPFILRVFSKIYEKNCNSVLMLIGAVPTEELDALAGELGISDAILYLGVRNDVNELLQAGDVFLFPSIQEGLPMSVIEAQAAGLPTFISDAITNEVIATDLVKVLSLNSSPDIWAKEILETDLSSRRITTDQMQQSGWEITNTSQTLVDYYEG